MVLACQQCFYGPLNEEKLTYSLEVLILIFKQLLFDFNYFSNLF